jgi:formate C-acetyltransferase
MAATAPLKFPTGTEEFPWQGFRSGLWQKEVDVRDFIQQNYTPYEGDGSFLKPATLRTLQVWGKLQAMFAEERRKGVLDVSQIPASITAHPPGYIDRGSEVIVGLQTDAPLKRAIMPDALFDAYTSEMKRCRSSHILTGLSDAYGRGRIIGDYSRVALYGVKRLIERKRVEKSSLDSFPSSEAIIRDREELAEQTRALEELQQMAKSYGFDISRPATNGREAVQWLYFGYLAGVKEQNGAAMSLGRTATFLDIYLERDIAAGVLAEEHAQEIIDDFVIKLRIVRFLRTPEYDELFGGDPP